MRAIALWTFGWLALLGAAAGVSPRAPAIPDAPLNNAIAAERLVLDGARARTLYVGSSMIGQLPLSDTAALSVGLSARGAATGLFLVTGTGAHPATVVVETNRLLESVDSAYVDSLLQRARPRWPWLRMTRLEFRPSSQAEALVVRVERALRGLRGEAGKRAAEARAADAFVANAAEGALPSGPGAAAAALAKAGVASAAVDSAREAATARWAAARLAEWQRTGVRVFLVELPMHDAIARSPRELRRRQMVDAMLPAGAFPRLTLPARAWRTSDGRHLEPDDARALATWLQNAVAHPPQEGYH